METAVVSAVRTRELSRTFGPVTALDRVSVDLPESGVIGLVGPNGSGKSTLIRILLGLIPPTGGTATVLGESIDAPQRYAARVGALIEGPAFVPGLTARRNLLALSRLRGLPGQRVDEVLAVVDLADRAGQPVRTFSLGMKQRLGIAAALLPDPRLLILDEPTNGLDPAGIVEIRELLRDLGQQGRAVVVSSHLLAEIEAACDQLVVIRHGRLLYSGPTSDLLARAVGHVSVAPEFDTDATMLRAALTGQGWTVTHVGAIQVQAPATDAAAINRAAAAAGITLRHLTVGRDSLEDIFLALTDRPADTPVGA